MSRPLNVILELCWAFCISFWYFVGFRLQTAFVPQPFDGKASQEGLKHSKMSWKLLEAMLMDHGAKHSPYCHQGTSRPLNGILCFVLHFALFFPQTCLSMRGSDWSMVENRVIVVELVARLRAQFFSYFNTVILRAQFIAVSYTHLTLPTKA